MAFRTRNLIIFLSLLLVIGSGFSALSTKRPLGKPASSTSDQLLTRAQVELLKHEDGVLLLEWECPEIEVEYDSTLGRIIGINMAGAAAYAETGVPYVPQLIQFLDCLPGPVRAEVVDLDVETRTLGAMAATPPDQPVDARIENDPEQADPPLNELQDPRSWMDRSAGTPLRDGLFPAETVTLRESGIFRGHRLLALQFYPVQVSARQGIARVVRRARIRVTMPRNETAVNRLPDRPAETQLVRDMLGALAVTAQPGRAPEAFEGRGADRGGLDEEPIGGRWKLVVRERGIVRVTAEDLRFAFCPVEQISTHDTHIRHRGQEIPIHFAGGVDGRFDDGDYIQFYGEPNERTAQQLAPEFYADRWTEDNVYWLSWGDGRPGMRLGDEAGTFHAEWPLQDQTNVSNVRTVLHFERDLRFDRLGKTTTQYHSRMQNYGPLGVAVDHFFWGTRIDGLTTREFQVGLPVPDTRTLGSVVVRAALQGFSWSTGDSSSGQHRAIVYINGKTAPGLSAGKVSLSDPLPAWVGQTPIILQSRPSDTSLNGIVTSDLVSGINTISVSLPGDGPAGVNDKIYANWFEVEYDRALRASGAYLLYNFDRARGDTFIFDVRGFGTRNVEIWKLGHSRLTNLTIRRVTPADEGASYAVRYQMISDGAYDVLLFDDRYPKPPAAILRETGTRDLRALPGAEYLIIYNDLFADDPFALPWLMRLDSLRRVTFNGSVDTIRVSQIYEQFNGGIVNPEAIRDFLQFAYEHWFVRPTHACLIGDGVMNLRSRSQAGNLISSLYPMTDDFGAAAADGLFGMVSGPPWDILPDIAVGRISCRTAQELQVYVEKLVRYEDPAARAYNTPFHSTVLFISDLKDRQFNFDRGYSEPAVGRLPEHMNVRRVYLDSLRGSQGQNALRDALQRGALIANYNGHGGGGVWSGTELMTVPGVTGLRNQRAYSFISNFTCYVGAFDDDDQSAVLGEAFLFSRNSGGDPVGAIGVYSSTGVGWANAGREMQLYLFDFIADLPARTIGEIVQLNKVRYWSSRGNLSLVIDPPFSMMMMMTLLGDPGVRLKLPNPLWQDFAADTSVVSHGDTVFVSGTLPWDVSAAGARLYLNPYNSHFTTVELEYGAARTTNRYKVPAFDWGELAPEVIYERSFQNVPLVIPDGLVAVRNRVVVYATDMGDSSSLPHDALGSFPLYIADSLTQLRVENVTAFPTGFIFSDSVFHVQANILYQQGIQRVVMRSAFRPAQGPVVIDSVELGQVEPGLWRSPQLGPLDVAGGSYHVQFLVQPVAGELITSADFALRLERFPDFNIQQSVLRPELRPGAHPYLRVPVGYNRYADTRRISALTVRLTARQEGGTPPDSFVTEVTILGIDTLSNVIEVRLPLELLPLTYRLTVVLDPYNQVRESSEGNNIYTLTVPLPNLYPATQAEGSVLPRRAEQTPPAVHRYWQPGGRDTLQLKLNPGSIPMDSTTLIYSVPGPLSGADLANLAAAGLAPPDTGQAVNVFRVLMHDSTDGLLPGGSARVSLTFAGISDSTRMTRLALFGKRAAAGGWHRLENQQFEITRRDTITLPGGGRRITWSGRLAGTTAELGSFALFSFNDTQGPAIEVSVGGLRFTRNSILPRHPEIYVNLSDLNGIDRSAGRFYVMLDSDTIPEGQLVWSDTLESSGRMSALFRPDLEPGHHTLRVRATDNSGLTDSLFTEFEVSGEFGIQWAINYPNPFNRSTTISYLLTDVTDDFVEIRIYTVSGRLIRTLREVERAVANYRELTWDGRDEGGEEIANGVYFARIKAKQGEQAVEKIVKLAKVR